jgi:hypothetical protein
MRARVEWAATAIDIIASMAEVRVGQETILFIAPIRFRGEARR